MIFAEDAIEELRTIGDLVRWGASRFDEAGLTYGHGTDNALDEAYAMICHVLHLAHNIPPYMINSRLTKAERRSVINLFVERITTRKPAPYLLQQAWFAGLPFYVDENVLIPRSPIAELIEARFEPWIDSESVNHILDMCTGGGCIAIACAMAFLHSMVDASDISRAALDVAKRNIDRHGLSDRVNLIESDVFSALSPNTKKYDVIVSNPPYVNAKDMATLTPEFRHEPVLALRAGFDGLTIVKQILKRASEFLTDNGLLVVETGNSYISLLEQLPEVPFVWPEFERGGQGVFIITAQQLIEYKDQIEAMV